MIHRLVILLSALWIGLAFGADLPVWLRPDPKLTPGKAADDGKDVCATKWGRDARHVTAAMKLEVYHRYNVTNHKGICAKSRRGCEIDHLVSRELSGADDVDNLWPQPYGVTWGAEKKDALENRLHKLICAGELDLAEAQRCIATDWIECYRNHMK